MSETTYHPQSIYTKWKIERPRHKFRMQEKGRELERVMSLDIYQTCGHILTYILYIGGCMVVPLFYNWNRETNKTHYNWNRETNKTVPVFL